jgi:hypothetical protein
MSVLAVSSECQSVNGLMSLKLAPPLALEAQQQERRATGHLLQPSASRPVSSHETSGGGVQLKMGKRRGRVTDDSA